MRFVFGFISLLVLLVVGLLAAPSFIDFGKYKAQGLEQVKTRTGYDIEINGDFKVAFLPAPHVTASGVRVINPSASDDPIATFDELSVGVAVAPLFKKQVQVTDISLDKPVFDLRLNREGKGNWLSPEVEALLEKEDDDGANAKPSKTQNIAFDKVSIEDGALRFFDAAKGKETQITDVNLDLAAESLNGPFDANGTLKFADQEVEIDLETEAINKDASTLPLRADVKYGAYDVSLNGVAGIAAPYDVQGETEIKMSASALPISEDVVIAGILSANQNSAAIKDSVVTIGSSQYKGEGVVNLKPLSVKAAYEGSDVIDLAKFLPAKKEKKASNDPLLMLIEIMPKSITLPQDFEADIALKTGGLLYDQILLKNTSVKASKTGQSFKVALKAADIPGSGPASVDGDVNFASRSTSKNGAQVYSDPTLNFTVQANTQNTGNLVKALTGKTNIPIVSTSRIGKFYIKGNAKPGRFALNDSVVNLDDLKVLMGGNIAQGKTKPVLDFNVSSSIDDPYAFAKSLSVKTDSWPQNLGAIRVGADLKGTMDDLMTDAKVNAFGADFSVSGKLDELKSSANAGAGIDNLKVRVQHPNLAKFLSNFGVSAPEFAAVSKPIDARAAVKMDGKVLNLSAIDAKLLGTTMTGGLRYDGGAGKPDASGNLVFGTLELKSNNQGGSNSSGGSGGSSGGKWSNTKMNSGWLHVVNADFDIVADRLIYETWDVSKPSIKLSMNNGVLNVEDLKGGMFDGQIAMKSKISSASVDAPMSLSADADISNVNVGQLAEALSGTQKLKGDGTVSLEMSVAGSGASQKAIVSSLNGNARLNGSNVVLKGFDLAGLASALLESNKPLPRVQQLVGASTSGGQTAFDTIKGDYGIANGVVNINSMVLDGPSASISSKGNADLPKWYINTTHTITLKQTEDLDPFDVAIKGPLDNPTNTFGKGLFNTYLNEKLGDKLNELIGDKVGSDVSGALQKFGILPTAKTKTPAAAVPSNDNVSESAPAAGDEAQPLQEEPAPAPKTQEEQAQEAIEGVIKGLFQ